MLITYIQTAMGQAEYEWLPDDRIFYGAIPGFQGLWASGDTEESCREELLDRLQEWIVISLRDKDELPILNGINLNIDSTREVA